MAESKIKIGIVEDEAIIAENIAMALAANGYEALEPAESYDEALSLVRSQRPDLVLIDIVLKGSKSGIDLAHYLSEHERIPFIFLTSNSDKRTVGLAKTTRPSAYLLKPFNKDDIYTAVEIALYNYANRAEAYEQDNVGLVIRDALFVKHRERYIKVPFTEVAYLQSDHVYVDLTCISGAKYTLRSSLENLLQQFPPSFFRTHRSYAVNTAHIGSINHSHVYIGRYEIPVSKSYRDQLLSIIKVV